jgi:hypothetical protein
MQTAPENQLRAVKTTKNLHDPGYFGGDAENVVNVKRGPSDMYSPLETNRNNS